MPLFIFRSNDYTEFKTCTRCNTVVTDTYDSLETTTIGMCVVMYKHDLVFDNKNNVMHLSDCTVEI
jgi:hypothetical protein